MRAGTGWGTGAGTVSAVSAVTRAAATRDIELTVTDVEVDIDDPCTLEELITGALEGIIETEVEGRISREVTRAVQLVLGSQATTDFGVPASVIPACAFDSDCAVGFGPGGLLFGGSRHGCIDHDGDGATPTICDLVRFEMRRLYVGPRGVDLVIADGTDDPQWAAFGGRMLPPPVGPDDVLSCAPTRLVLDPGVTLSSGATPARTPIASGRSNTIILDASSNFCAGTDPAPGFCICAQTGTRCGFPPAVAAAGFVVPGMAPVPFGLTCQANRCCLADGVTCAVRDEP